MTRKLTTTKHVCAPPCWNTVPMESHSNGQLAGYFPRILQTLLRSLGYGEPPLFIGTPRLLLGNTYLWHVWVVIYKKSMTDHTHCIRQVIEVAARGGRSREEFAMLHKKLRPRCVTTKMTKWSTHNINTFRAESVKELMLW
jgi:hypothetical protein